MTATTTPALCVCGHGKLRHQGPDGPECSAVDCTCADYRSTYDESVATPIPGLETKTCNRCSVTKPLTEFYRAHGVPQGMCKDCDNARPRPPTPTKIIRIRARHRAVAELIRRHGAEFRGLLEALTLAAQIEAEQLAKTAPAQSSYKPTETVRLRSGPKRGGQTTEDRIDVARCPECVKHHDRGHVCASCGSAPHAARAAS